MVLIRVLAARTEAVFIFVAVLRLLCVQRWLNAICGNFSLVICFLHHLVVFVMFPFLVLVGLAHDVVFAGLLDDCALGLLGILIIVVFCEVVIVVAAAVGVVVVVITSSLVVPFAIIPFTVIPVGLRIILRILAATASVLLGAPVLVIPIISVAVPSIWTRSSVASKLWLIS